MQELSLNVLDLAQNSIRAGASQISVAAAEHPTEHLLTITVSDNGCGMTKKEVRQAEDPFFTTRTTRKIGLGRVDRREFFLKVCIRKRDDRHSFFSHGSHRLSPLRRHGCYDPLPRCHESHP